MFGSITVRPKALEDYRQVIGEEPLAELRRLAIPLMGARVLHLNITPFGTGVAEMLSSLVPLMNDLGLICQWQIIRTADEFIAATNALYNALAGGRAEWRKGMNEIWLKYSVMNAALFDQDYDFIVVHDPQPAAILSAILQQRGQHPAGRWVWHCHLDLSQAQKEAWQAVASHAQAYDAIIVDMEHYFPPKGQRHTPLVIPPALDPLSPKNMDIGQDTIAAILERYCLDSARPIICQVAPLDKWNNPLGLIQAYRMAREHHPELQLALVDTSTTTDEETQAYFQQVAELGRNDPDLHIFSSLNDVGNVEINVFQRAARVVVQRSLRRGFGMSVTEALWKERPVVAGAAGGIPRQIRDGATGYLVASDEECAARILHLLANPELSRQMGRAGREQVKQNHLITRLTRDYLEFFQSLP